MVLPPVRYFVKITAAIVVTLVVAYSIYRARSILILIFLGMFLAVGLEPMIGRLERRGIRRGFAVLGFGLLFAGLLVALVFLVIAPAAEEVTTFVSNVPDLIDDLNKRVQGTAVGDYLNQPEVQQKIQDGFTSLLQRSAGGIFGIVGGVISAVFTALTLFVLTIYFMMAMPRLRASADRMLRTESRQAVLAEALAKVGGYVTGQLAICVCAGVCSYVALLLLDVPYPALLAIVITVLDAIPQVGATIGAVIAVLVAVTASAHRDRCPDLLRHLPAARELPDRTARVRPDHRALTTRVPALGAGRGGAVGRGRRHRRAADHCGRLGRLPGHAHRSRPDGAGRRGRDG